MIHLHKIPLLDPGHITPADAQLLRNLPLRPLIAAMIQAKPATDCFLLPLIKYIKIAVDLALPNLQLQPVHLRSNDPIYPFEYS